MASNIAGGVCGDGIALVSPTLPLSPRPGSILDVPYPFPVAAFSPVTPGRGRLIRPACRRDDFQQFKQMQVFGQILLSLVVFRFGNLG